MNLLVTAGNTQAPIDRVRSITNIFTGRTGAGIALEAQRRGHAVTLLTSHPETVAGSAVRVVSYRTFDELHDLLASHVSTGRYNALVHSAAVSDYLCDGVFAPAPGARFDCVALPALIDRAAGKVKSDAPEFW